MAYLAGNTDIIRHHFFTVGPNNEREYFNPTNLKVRLMQSPYEVIEEIIPAHINQVGLGIYDITIKWPLLVYDDIAIDFEWLDEDGHTDREGLKVDVVWALKKIAESKDAQGDSLEMDPLINKFYKAADFINQYTVVYLQHDGRINTAGTNIEGSEKSILGMAVTKAVPNQNVKIRVLDVVTNKDWNLSIGEVYYLGEDGIITTVKPIRGFVQRIGFAISSKSLYLQILPEPTDVELEQKHHIEDVIRDLIVYDGNNITVNYDEINHRFIFEPKAHEISFVPDDDIESTNVQDAIIELKNKILNKVNNIGFEDLIDTPKYHDKHNMLLHIGDSSLEFIDPDDILNGGDF